MVLIGAEGSVASRVMMEQFNLLDMCKDYSKRSDDEMVWLKQKRLIFFSAALIQNFVCGGQEWKFWEANLLSSLKFCPRVLPGPINSL